MGNFPGIAAHITHAVWTCTSHIVTNGGRFQKTSFLRIAYILVKLISPRVFRTLCSCGGPFPLPLGWKAIGFSRYLAHPSTIRFGIHCRYACHRMRRFFRWKRSFYPICRCTIFGLLHKARIFCIGYQILANGKSMLRGMLLTERMKFRETPVIKKTGKQRKSMPPSSCTSPFRGNEQRFPHVWRG